MLTALLLALSLTTASIPARSLPFLPPEPLRMPVPAEREGFNWPARRREDRKKRDAAAFRSAWRAVG